MLCEELYLFSVYMIVNCSVAHMNQAMRRPELNNSLQSSVTERVRVAIQEISHSVTFSFAVRYF